MCGILGFMTDRPNKENAKYFKRILYLSESRGRDATGIFYTNTNKVKGDAYCIEKQPMKAPDFIKDILPKHLIGIEDTNIALGHTRSPTQGDPKDNNNNHPLEGENWIIIHNGSVTKMPRLDGYKYKGEVDSEVLLSYIEKYGLKEGLPYVERGSASLAIIDKHDLNSVYLWREANPIVLACDIRSNTIFFASQKEFLERGLANRFLLFTSFQIRDLPANMLIKISINPFTVTSMGYIEVMKYNPTRYAYTPTKSDIKSMEFNPVTHRWEHPKKKDEPLIIGVAASTSASTVTEAANDKCIFLTLTGQCFKGFTIPCPTNILECDYFTHPDKADTTKNSFSPMNEQNKKYLREKGFTDAEGDRMTAAALATIMYCEYNGTDVIITDKGEIELVKKSVPHAYAGLDTKHDINKYYIEGMSHDFRNWTKLTKPNKGHLSADGTLIKKWDNVKKSHFIITVEDAIKEKLIDITMLQADIDEAMDFGDNGGIEDRLVMEE